MPASTEPNALARRRPQRKHCWPAAMDTLERRLLFSSNGTLTTIAAFNGANGFSPAAVVEDAHGNIFGVTLFVDVGAASDQSGEVFEIPAGTNAIHVIAQFSNAGGVISPTSLIIDSSGNLFGAETDPGGNGSVFEVAVGSNSITHIASFPTIAQQVLAGTQGNLTVVDSAGDLFGIDSFGNAIEVVAGSGTVTTLIDMGAHSLGRLADLRLGADGNLYGITRTGVDTIFKFSPVTSTLTNLATLDATTDGTTPTGITFDASGNIWGFSREGGANGVGAVWELPAGGNTVSLVASFSASTGSEPVSSPTFDSAGNLVGLTANGGANDDGTLFEIPAGSSVTPVDLTDFTSIEQVPDVGSGIVANSAGVAPNLSGATTGTSFAFFGALFGDVSSVAPSDVHPDFNTGHGAVDGLEIFGTTPPPPKIFRPPLTPELEAEKAKLAKLFNELGHVGKGSAASNELHALRITLDAAQTVDPQATSKSALAALLAPIKKQLVATQHQLNAATTLVNKHTQLAAKFNKETAIITGLESQLAKQSKSSAKAAIQKKLTAAEAMQAKILSQDDGIFNSANTDLTNIATAEDTIQGELDALP